MALSTRSRRIVDLTVAIIAMLLAIWLFIVAPEEAPGRYEGDIQPWFYPRIVLGFFIFFCLVMALVAYSRGDQEEESSTSTNQTESKALMDRQVILNAIVPTGLTILYVIGTIWIGYTYTTAIIGGVYMLYLGASLLPTLMASMGLATIVYFVFGEIMNIPLPLGRLFE